MKLEVNCSMCLKYYRHLWILLGRPVKYKQSEINDFHMLPRATNNFINCVFRTS